MISLNGTAGAGERIFSPALNVNRPTAPAVFKGMSASSAFERMSGSGAFKGRSASAVLQGRSASGAAAGCITACAGRSIDFSSSTALLNDNGAGMSIPVENRLFHDLRRIN